MSFYPSPVPKQRFLDANGVPLAGGQLFTYAAGTTTPQVTYANSTGTTNANPVVLDSQGYADIWLDPTLAYKFILEDASGVVQWTEDHITFPLGISVWNANENYAEGAIVADSSGFGLFYVSLTDNNLNNALTSVSSWRLLGGNIRTISTSSTLLVTDELIRSNSTSGDLTHTLPACSTTPIGKKITVKDIGTGTNSTTLQGSGTDKIDGNGTYAIALASEYGITVMNNGSSWDVISSCPNQTNHAASSSSGLFTVTSSTYADVTNLSVTVTTSGRAVLVTLSAAGSGSESEIEVIATSVLQIRLERDGTEIASWNLSAAGTTIPRYVLGLPAFLDFDAASGSHTYKIQAASLNGADIINNMMLKVAELA